MFILLIFACTKFPDNLKAVFRDCLISNQRAWNSFDSSWYGRRAANKILEVYIILFRS